MMKRVLSLSLLVLLLVGCRSNSRMLRNSPIEQRSSLSFESGNINVWPIYFKSGDYNSLLWPLIDFDRQGFAIRPLVTKDNNELGFFYPLSNFDTENGDFWIANFIWYDSKNYGMIPIFFKANDVLQLGPYFQTDSNFFLIPVAKLARTPNKFNYIGPVWWDDWSADRKFGMYPIGMYQKDDFSYCTLYWQYEDKHGVFPIYYSEKNGFTYLLNSWWSADKKTMGVIPLFMYTENLRAAGPVWWNKTGDGYGLFPLFFKTKDSSFLIPLYYFSSIYGSTTFASPLGGFNYVANADKDKLKYLNLLGIGYMYDSDDDFMSVLFPLFIKKRASWSLFPLMNYKNGAIPSPIFNYESEGNWNLLCGILGKRNSFIAHREYNLPYNSSVSKHFNRNGSVISSSSYNNILFGFGESKYLVWQEKYQNNSGLFLSLHYAFIHYNNMLENCKFNEKNRETKPELFEKSKSRLVEAEQNLRETLKKVYPEMAKEKLTPELFAEIQAKLFANTEVKEYKENSVLLSLLWKYNSFGEDIKYRALCGLVRGEKTKYIEELTILELIYRYRADGENNKTHIFPFISIKNAPNKYSCGWISDKFIGYRNIDGKKSMSLFFFDIDL